MALYPHLTPLGRVPEPLLLAQTSPPPQVQKVLGEYKDEGVLGLVNLIGDYNYVEMESLEGDDVMKMMQVRQPGSLSS